MPSTSTTPRCNSPCRRKWSRRANSSMVSLPAYQVEPPDILMIEMLKMVPLPPYRIDIYDVLQIRVMGTLPDQPIDGFFLVEGEGIVTLGPAYGRVRVAGMTVEQASEAITDKLKEMLEQAGGLGAVGPNRRHRAGHRRVPGRPRRHDQPAAIRHAARGRQDGHRDSAGLEQAPGAVLRFAGRVGRGAAIQQQGVLRDHGRGGHGRQHPPRADHRQRHGDGRLKRGQRFVAGVQREGLGGAAGAGRFGCEQILPVDYEAITQGGSAATNYQIMPGDRVFMAGDNMIAANSWLTKMTAPIERLFGIASLGTSTARSWETLGREYNRTRF